MPRIHVFAVVSALGLLLCSVCPPLVAADEPAKNTAPDDHTAYTFDDDLVRGDGVSPNAELLSARRRKDRDSLVRARESFVVELLSSVEKL